MKAKPASAPALSIQTGNFENRLKLVIQALGGNKQAAPIAGVTDEMLYRYTKSISRPSFEVVANLALSAGYSLDWLCTGEGPEKRVEEEPLKAVELDADTLRFCLEALETALQRSGKTLSGQKRAEVLAVFYRFAMDDKQAGKPPAEAAARILQLVKLAS